MESISTSCLVCTQQHGFLSCLGSEHPLLGLRNLHFVQLWSVFRRYPMLCTDYVIIFLSWDDSAVVSISLQKYFKDLFLLSLYLFYMKVTPSNLDSLATFNCFLQYFCNFLSLGDHHEGHFFLYYVLFDKQLLIFVGKIPWTVNSLSYDSWNCWLWLQFLQLYVPPLLMF